MGRRQQHSSTLTKHAQHIKRGLGDRSVTTRPQTVKEMMELCPSRIKPAAAAVGVGSRVEQADPVTTALARYHEAYHRAKTSRLAGSSSGPPAPTSWVDGEAFAAFCRSRAESDHRAVHLISHTGVRSLSDLAASCLGRHSRLMPSFAALLEYIPHGLQAAVVFAACRQPPPVPTEVWEVIGRVSDFRRVLDLSYTSVSHDNLRVAFRQPSSRGWKAEPRRRSEFHETPACLKEQVAPKHECDADRECGGVTALSAVHAVAGGGFASAAVAADDVPLSWEDDVTEPGLQAPAYYHRQLLGPYCLGDLVTLDLTGCPNLTGGGSLVFLVAESFPKLRRLLCAGCFVEEDGPATFRSLMRSGMQSLAYVDLSYTPFLTGADFQTIHSAELPRLAKLRLVGCPLLRQPADGSGSLIVRRSSKQSIHAVLRERRQMGEPPAMVELS